MKLGAIFSGMARRLGDREAIVCGHRRLTFRELDSRTNSIAHSLVENGVKFGDRIAVYAPNGVELVEAMIGALKMGGVVTPISTHLTSREVEFIFDSAKPTAIFFSLDVESTARTAAQSLEAPLMISTDGEGATDALSLWKFVSEGSTHEMPPLPLEPDDCLIAFTSGTTGRPKGAISTHANVTVFSGFLNSVEYGLTDQDIILVPTPMAHRTGLSRMGNLFVSGCKLVVMKKFDAVDAVNLIEIEKITVLSCVPTVIRLLLPEIERRPYAVKSLRLITATGEVFPADIKNQLTAVAPHVGLYTYYAGTETGTVTALHPHEQDTHPDSMGRAIPGVEVRIVDSDMTDVADGDSGEMLVRCGAPGTFTTMRAYLDRADATAEAFVDGWLRSGDIVRRDMDGFYYFVDRAKDMIVSGGFNIYSKEVELTLVQHPAVVDAAVISVPDLEFGEAVMAFVELKTNAKPTATELIQHCRDHIASYKKPKYIRHIERLPRTSTGKVIKDQLRKLAIGDAAMSSGKI